jgi:hypothetical protein
LSKKNGDQYIFLTHEEQDINREIKNISVDLGEVIQKISEIVFEEIYPDKKYKYSSRYNFSFNQVVDDRFFRGNQGNDIGLKIITPYYDTGVELTDNELKLMTMRENNLIVKLPNDTTFLDEMEEVLKIETFLRRKGGTSLTQKIGKYFKKMGFTASKETRNPHSHFVGSTYYSFFICFKESVKMLCQFFCNNIFFKFLLYIAVIVLTNLDYTPDISINRFFKHILYQHI